MKNVEDIYPLSPLQQGLLFHTLLAPAAESYVNQLSCTLQGELDAGLFRRTWEAVVERHAILRSAFVWEGMEQPLQVVRQQVKLEWEDHDWRGLAADELAGRLAALRTAERRRPFNLAKAPLMRMALVRHGDRAQDFVWTFHHLLLDGWSTPVLFQEIFAVYGALHASRRPALPPVHSYREYIAWLQRQDMARAEAFWRRALAGFTAPTPLGIDRPETGGEGFAERQAQLPAELAAALQALAAAHRLTPNTLLLGAWAALLGRYSGEPEVVLGSVVSGRPADLPGVESMIGLFINTLPVRLKLPAAGAALAWLQSLQAQLLELRQFEFSPLAQVQKWSEVPPGTPLFESLYVFENYPLGDRQRAAAGSGPELGLADVRNVESTHYPLTLAVSPGLALRASYDASRLEPGAVERLLGHLTALLTEIAARPDHPLAELRILSDGEVRQLAAWNQTRTDYPAGLCLHQWIEAQADRTPAAVALAGGGEELSYRELDARANRLARRLRELGCGVESPVGVFMERSCEMVIALLAILKAGGAYVPLDPEHPAERVAFQAADARVPVVLTQPHLASRLPPLAARAVAAGATAPAGPEDAERLAGGALPDNAAYVLYTSGSTGRPKGVVISHRGIVNRLLWMQDAYRLTAADRVLQKTPFSFDVSVWEFFWPLMTGARLVVARPGGHRDSAYLAQLVAEQEITVLHFVPSMLQLFVEEPAAAAARSLRDVMASGEALPAELVQRFQARLGARLHNLYGPTEASVDVTAWTCEPNAPGTGVPIGRPIANTRIQVLDRWLRQVPAGVAAELTIGGVNLARGYAGRPDLTAERFVPDPTGSEPGGRLYRTGDLARHRADGALEFLGRIDHQVKIRGFRIELGEIEAALAGQPGVREAAVAVYERAGHRSLVAYVVAAGEPAPRADELGDALGRTLPEYMVPARFVLLPELPLNANGKLDRHTLPAPDPAGSGEPFAPPEGPTEQALAEIWSAVLGVGRVSRDDNFFALGGDSILSLRVLAQARERGLDLTLPQIFQRRTLRGLARETSAAAVESVRTEPFSLLSADDRGRLPETVADAYPLSRLQAGMLFHSELSPETAVYHDVFSSHLEAPFDEAPLRRALGWLVARHPILRTAFDLTSFSEPLQLVQRELEPDLEIADLRHLDGPAQQAFLAAWREEEKARPLDWRRAPLLRLRIHRRSDATFQLTLSFHHAILDGWSVASMVSELFRTYLGLRRGTDARKPEPGSSFHRFVALEREALASAATRRYWADTLAGAPVTTLPRWPGAGRREGRKGSGAVERPLPLQLTARLQTLARTAGLPLKSVLLAAHGRVLAALSGQDEVVTGLVVNGRPEEDGGEQVLGLFLNTLPLRLAPAAAGSWRELVQSTFEAEAALLPHRRFPLADLQRERGGRPLFEPVFNYVHFHVYQGLAQLGEVRSLGSDFFEETNFPLLASFSLTDGNLNLRLEHDRDDLPDDQVEAIGGLYERTLAALAADPEAEPAASPVLSTAEESLLAGWNATAHPDPEPLGLHQMIERQAARTPGAPAVTYDGRTLSYAELDREAGRLARRLAALGCGAETRVAIALERSLELMVGLLAILKTGAAYVPLDPEYPRERLAFMLEDSRPAVLLTARRMLGGLPATGVATLCLDEPLDGPESPLPGFAGDLQLAYVIYTSGSTGRPKGAMLHHRGIRNRLLWMQRAYGLTAADTVLQKTPISFDVSVWELFWPLLAGARLVLARPGGHRDPAYLAELIAREQVTVLHFVPSMLQAFLAEPGLAPCRSLRLVVASGEALPPSLERRFCERLDARLENLYGPTEASVDVTSWACGPGEHRSVPIGRPIDNTQIHLLDRALRPVPVGAPGELFIGGVNVGRGYLARPGLTAGSFVPDPFAAEPGARLYRTGDLARHLPGGEVEFLGRIDHQVKLRGFRIELGEIEAALAAHDAVREAAVLLREDAPGDPRLAAYVVPARNDAPPAPAELRASLLARLPEHMVPGTFTLLAALPLTPNGKLDRRALPSPEPAQPDRPREYAAPRTPAESTLVRIWEEVLRLERVGIHDHLLEIGGHSLLATQIVARIREAFRIALPLRTLFNAPTVAELAVAVVQKQAEEADAQLLESLLARVEGMQDGELEAFMADAPALPEPIHD